MQFIPPPRILMPFVKGYFVVTINQDINNEVFYPSGFIDFAVNISNGSITTVIDGRHILMPKVEILGQLTVPTRLNVTKGTSILVARIYPYANVLFFPNPISDFTNDSIDLDGVLSTEADQLYDKLAHAKSLEQKIDVLNCFFIRNLKRNEGKLGKVKMIGQLCNSICNEDVFDMQILANHFGLSERYIQRLFESTVGLTPRIFYNTNRFNKSLELIRSSDQQLTSIAYSCGYFDQAHFIKEFRRFTGITPSQARMLSL